MMNSSINNTMFINNKKKKTTQGRKKIEIKKIDNISNRQVTFSKRRAGLFKKASELCILTGAEVAIIVQSSGKRVYAFGHPSVDGVIDRFTAKGSSSSSFPSSSSSSSRNNTSTIISYAEMHQHNLEYNKLCQELEAEKKRMEVQEKAGFMNNGGNISWWEEPIDHLGLEELEQYAAALEELRKNVLTRADELALLKNSHALGVMNNVDLNQTMAMTSIMAVGCDDLVPNQAIQYCPTAAAASSSVPATAMVHYDFNNFGNP